VYSEYPTSAYLMKVAATGSPELTRRDRERISAAKTRAGMIGAGAGLTATMGGQLAAALSAGRMLLGEFGDRELSPDEVKRMAKNMGLEGLEITHDVPVGVGPGAAGPHYMPKGWNKELGEYVFVPKKADPGILAHELGHAKGMKSRVGRLFSNKASRLAFMSSPLLALGGGVAAGVAAPDSDLAAYGLPAASAAMTAPTLVDEASASIRGHRALKELGYAPEALAKSRKAMARAFGTYGATALAAIAAPILARRWARGQHKDIEKIRREG